MKSYRLALIGFGNVGQGLARILTERAPQIEKQFGAQFELVAVCDLLKGSVYDPAGLSPAQLLQVVQTDGHLRDYPAPHKGWSIEQTIAESNAQVILEMSYTNLETGQPATGYIEQALQAGKHVVTTNKGPIALFYPRLQQLAQANGVILAAEGTVMSGTPTLRMGLELLAPAGMTKIQGILNGTTNYMLTRMAQGCTYAEALAEAQAQGYAEADPTGDVEGHDAAGKVVILANMLFNYPLQMAEVACEGITQLTPADIQTAEAAGERWKLIGQLEKSGAGLIASVRPTRLPLTHPLASVSGATNAITFTTELLGDVTLIGPGAGRLETGYALLEDLLAIHRQS